MKSKTILIVYQDDLRHSTGYRVEAAKMLNGVIRKIERGNLEKDSFLIPRRVLA